MHYEAHSLAGVHYKREAGGGAHTREDYFRHTREAHNQAYPSQPAQEAVFQYILFPQHARKAVFQALFLLSACSGAVFKALFLLLGSVFQAS